MSGLDPNAGGALVVPGGGASLPTASGAGEVPLSDGAGTAYTAASLSAAIATGVQTSIEGLLGATAGAAVIGDGAGGIDVTSADVSAMLAAANAAAARAALGVTAPSHTTGTLAARPASPGVGDTYALSDVGGSLRCDVAGTWAWSHGGPLAATRGPFSGAGAWITGRSAGLTAGPIGGPGTSGAIELHVTTLPGAGEVVLAEHDVDGGGGWILGACDVTNNRPYFLLRGMSGSAKIEIAGADLTTGSWAIAWTISASEIRYSVNGGTVGTVAISGTYTAPLSTSRFVLGNHISVDVALSTAEVAWFQAWSTPLGDAALQAVTAAHATYLPGASGATPVASYLAGSHARYDVSGQLVGTEGAALVVEPATAGWTAR